MKGPPTSGKGRAMRESPSHPTCPSFVRPRVSATSTRPSSPGGPSGGQGVMLLGPPACLAATRAMRWNLGQHSAMNTGLRSKDGAFLFSLKDLSP